MDQQPTCGQGLAQHAALPLSFADVIGAVAENLELHLTALDPNDKQSRPEFNAYGALATQHRELESRLRAIALQMEGYRDLPVAAHDMSVMTSPKLVRALERLVAQEESLTTLLVESVEQYQQMLKAR
jgi:hypothetical protein